MAAGTTGGAGAARWVIVQHAEKQPLAGDPDSRRGAGTKPAPSAIGAALGLAVRIDGRLRERLNWGGPTPACHRPA